MLCQKCGVQDATVHLETMVFRQKIEEHLCVLCAGVRAGESQSSADASERFRDPSHPAASGGIQEKILHLLRLSKQQGHLTFDDLQAALPESIDDQRAVDFIFSALQILGIEIVEADQLKDLQEAKAPSSPGAPASADLVHQFLQERGNRPALSAAQEAALFKRLRHAEARAATTAFSIPTAGRYFVEIGARLVAHNGRPRNIVQLPKTKSPAQYFESLPALLDAVRRHEARAVKAWTAHLAARTAAKRQTTRAALRRRESALRALFPRFHFKLRMYEEYLVQLQPVLAEIAMLESPVLRSHSKRKPLPAGDPVIVETRLRAIEIEHRIAPARIAATVRRLSVFVVEANRAKTALLKAHLRDVIEIANENLPQGASFIALVTAGNAGLAAAIENFRPRRGTRFTVFAAPLIRQAIVRKSAP